MSRDEFLAIDEAVIACAKDEKVLSSYCHLTRLYKSGPWVAMFRKGTPKLVEVKAGLVKRGFGNVLVRAFED